MHCVQQQWDGAVCWQVMRGEMLVRVTQGEGNFDAEGGRSRQVVEV